MTWQENIRRWRALSPERKLQIRVESIPLDVAESMTFEGEPVPVEKIREILARIATPVPSKPVAKSPATSN